MELEEDKDNTAQTSKESNTESQTETENKQK
jgi:hypothetical protein